MHSKDADGIANSVDPVQTQEHSTLVCTVSRRCLICVCQDLSVRKLRLITVNIFEGKFISRIFHDTVNPLYNVDGGPQ